MLPLYYAIMSSQALPPLLPRNHLARLLCNAYSACRHQSPKDHQAANLPAQNNSASSRSVRSLPVQSFVHCALLKRESGAGFGMASDVIDRDGLVCGVEQPRILSLLKRAHCIILFAGSRRVSCSPPPGHEYTLCYGFAIIRMRRYSPI